MIDQLTHEALIKNIQTKFRMSIGPERQIELELVKVSELKVFPGQEQFGIEFRGPGEAFLGQGTRSLSHHNLGEFELFLVPIRQDAQGVYYEAIFNRLTDPAAPGD